MSCITSLKLTPGDGALNLAQNWLNQTAAQHHWSARTTFALQISMDEALTNILSHGFENGISDASMIRLTVTSMDTLITLEIVDNGIPFDPTEIVPDELVSSLEDTVPGGHGLRLMRHYLHDMHYAFIDGHNHLKLSVVPRKP